MYLTWTALHLESPVARPPWTGEGAVHAQVGHTSLRRAEVPDFRGDRWAVFAVWDRHEQATHALPARIEGAVAAWHVVLEPAGYRGDATLVGGVTPFDAIRPGRVRGAAAVITLAGLSDDPARLGEFLERFTAHGRELAAVDGHRIAMVQAPTEGAVLTFSAWDTLRAAVTWAYHRPEHAATVRRHEEHGLVARSGFLRCAVLGSAGSVGGGDPLAGLSGTVERNGDRHGATR